MGDEEGGLTGSFALASWISWRKLAIVTPNIVTRVTPITTPIVVREARSG